MRAHGTARRTVAAVDLGAESGRVAAVSFDGERLDMEIAHRFRHSPRSVGGVLRWDIDTLSRHVTDGLAALAATARDVSSVGVDTWGVDYGLLDAAGGLVDAPTCYRDDRNLRAMRTALDRLGAPALYDATGIQLVPINTVFGLYSDVLDHPDRLAAARTLLMMPDVFHHLLCGSTVSEYTAVSTTGAYDMATGRWATDLLARLGIPDRILPDVVPPGTDVGPLAGAAATGALAGARVIVPPGHDTASAVVAVPFADPGALFISSGTWSLVGVETDRAIITDASRRANLTNEGGYGGTIRLLRNVMGLWILQECRRRWAASGTQLDYAEIVRLAAAQPGFTAIINPDDPLFLPPGDMPSRIRDFCARAGSPVPETIGEIARCVMDSLALSYRAVAEDIAAVTGNRLPSIAVVGGGANNALLAQLTADATGLPVHCGRTEATALGNGAVQLAALGEFSGLPEIREVLASGSQVTSYLPRSDDRWSEAADRFRTLSLSSTAVRRQPSPGDNDAPQSEDRRHRGSPAVGGAGIIGLHAEERGRRVVE